MKLIQSLKVDDVLTRVIDCDIRLTKNRAGTARFHVKSSEDLKGVVIFETGFSGSKTVRYFLGYIVNSVTVSPQEKIIFCRELTAVLNMKIYLGLRYVTATDVLKEVSQKTGLDFNLSTASEMKRQSPFFYHLGCGYQLMDTLSKVYEIPDFFWQQNGDGTVYAGGWGNSRWAESVRKVTIPDNLFTQHHAHNNAHISLIPTIRPGVLFNRGIISSVHLKNEGMNIQWNNYSSG